VRTDRPSETGERVFFVRVEKGPKGSVIETRIAWVEDLDAFLGNGSGQVLPSSREKVPRKFEIFRIQFQDEFEASELRLDVKAGAREAVADRFPGGAGDPEVAAGYASGIEGGEEPTADLSARRRGGERAENVRLIELHLNK
jgi:hypothetical protein